MRVIICGSISVTWRSCISYHFPRLCAARAPATQGQYQVPTISVADPDPGSGAFSTPGSGMGKKACDMEVLHLVPLPRGLVQHVHLSQFQYAERVPGTRPMCNTCTWHKVQYQEPTIRDSDPYSFNTDLDPDPGFFMTKNRKNSQLKNKFF